MPPRHLADLDEAGRASAVAELGLPAFRGKQLANQYYGRLIADPHEMTDLPAAVREQVAEALFPRLLDAMQEMGGRYLYIILMVFLEHHLSRGDYRRPGGAPRPNRFQRWRHGGGGGARVDPETVRHDGQ